MFKQNINQCHSFTFICPFLLILRFCKQRDDTRNEHKNNKRKQRKSKIHRWRLLPYFRNLFVLLQIFVRVTKL